MPYLLVFFLCMQLLIAVEPIAPIPLSVQVDKNKAILGKKLFFDARLSKNDTVACASCHILSQGGDDNLRVSIGINGQSGVINSPTVLNAVFNFRQFWDGHARTLQEQAEGPIMNPVEMGSVFSVLIEKLQKTEYRELFSEIYDDGLNQINLQNAIAEYEKTLTTPNARFDKYLRGNDKALNDDEKKGYELFKTKGCISCHHGINIGGNMFNKFGVYEMEASSELGRFNITHRERDKYFFKVPSLRNIALTAPYFHDGSSITLELAVKRMAKIQLGRYISEKEISSIVVFLKTLTGDLPIESMIYVP